MITPPYLKQGDTIGIFAPARSISGDEVQEFQSWATLQGFKIKFGQNLFGVANQFSGTDQERASDLNQLVADPEVNAVIAARGGYGSARILEEVDLSRVTINPKWLIGFSDITSLHSAFNRLAGLESLNAWMPVSLFQNNPYDAHSMELLQTVLTGGKLAYDLEPHPLNINGKATGELTGGNLSVLISLSGTLYEPDYDRKILFLEDVDEYLYHIDRMLLNFELRGVLQNICGLVVGAFTEMRDNKVPFGNKAFEIISERTRKLGIPVFYGFPAGHNHQNHPLIMGREATLTVNEKSCKLTFCD